MSSHRRRNRLRTGNEAWLTSYADLITNLIIFFVLIVAASEIKTGKMEKIASRLGESDETIKGTLSEAKDILEKAIETQRLKETVAVNMTDDGLELSFNSGLTFASGRAEILPEMMSPLKGVLAPLVPFADRYRFAVEGHTDQVPISAETSPFKSNWELASARSLEVREHLENIGVPRGRIRVEAYADTKPLRADEVRNLPMEESKARHRRVIIRVF